MAFDGDTGLGQAFAYSLRYMTKTRTPMTSHVTPSGDTTTPGNNDFSVMIDWLKSLALAHIPGPIIASTKQCLLDGLACLLAGLNTPPMKAYRQTLCMNSAANAGSLPLGNGYYAGLYDAANFYAQSANILDFDDGYRAAPSHPGATIIGPALACAHILKRSGDDLLLAILKAYEASLRIGASLCPSEAAPSKDIGYASWQTFGAYISAAALLDLDSTQWAQGFGLTAQQAPMPMIVRANPQGGYTWLKNTYGAAASTGVMSAFLAHHGYVGDQHFFSPDFGFWKAYGSDRFRPECLNTLPGEDWWIRNVEFKPWACCRWAQPAIEAVLRMKPNIEVNAIDAIEIHGFKEFCTTLDSPWPRNMIDAQFNVRFLLAVALLHDDINAVLRNPNFEDQALQDLFSKIHVRHDAHCDTLRRIDLSIPTRVVVTLAGKPQQEIQLAEPMGCGSRGIASMQETQSKFVDALAPIMPSRRIDDIMEIVMTLENHDASELMHAAFSQY